MIEQAAEVVMLLAGVIAAAGLAVIIRRLSLHNAERGWAASLVACSGVWALLVAAIANAQGLWHIICGGLAALAGCVFGLAWDSWRGNAKEGTSQ